MAASTRSEPFPALASYSMRAAYVEAVEALRSALAREALEIWAEVDVAKKIRRAFSMRLGRCALFSIGCPYALLRVLVAGPGAVAVLPLHVVIAERAGETHVYVLNAAKLATLAPNAEALKLDELMARLDAAIARAGGERI